MGAHPRARHTLVGDDALLGVVKPVDAIEHRAFTGTVGTNDGAHLAGPDIEADILNGLNAAKGQADVINVQQDVTDVSILIQNNVLSRSSPWVQGFSHRTIPDRR